MKRHKDDFYPTPPEATRALLRRESFDHYIWEPAAGNGALVNVLTEAGHGVIAADLNQYGFCKAGIDFLMESNLPEVLRPVRHLITNPPYRLAEDFISHAIHLGCTKHAYLLRLSFLEGVGRHQRLFSQHPPARIHVFSHRLTIWRGDQDQTSTGTTAYAWFVWDRLHVVKSRLALPAPVIEWITDAEE